MNEPLTIFEIAVRPMRRSLLAMSALLVKAEAHARARGVDPAVLLGYRLAPDMYDLRRQVQILTNLVKGTVARLLGVDVPGYADDDPDFAALRVRIGRTLAFIDGFAPAAFAGSEDRLIANPLGGAPAQYRGRDYVLAVALPNVYFHATAAYAILRHCGAPIGKSDFEGPWLPVA